MQLSRPLKQGIAFSLAAHAVLFVWLWSLEGAPVVFSPELRSADAPEETEVTFFVQAPARASPPPSPAPRPTQSRAPRDTPHARVLPQGAEKAPPGSSPEIPPTPTGVAPAEGAGASSESALIEDVPRLSAGQPSSTGPFTLSPRMSALGGAPSSTSGGISRLSDLSLDRVQRLLPGELTREANDGEALFTPEARALAMAHSLESTVTGRMRAPPGGNRAETPETPVALQAEQSPGPNGAVDLQRAANSLATLRSLSEGSSTPTWSLQLELLKTGPEFRVSLYRASRFPALDVMVQQRTRLWLADRRRSEPDFMDGIRRALWQVDAFVHYRKDVASLNAGDLPGLIATTPISGMGKGRTGDREQSWESRVLGLGLTLNVDVASGKAEVINLGSPQYRLELRLLESELESTDGGA